MALVVDMGHLFRHSAFNETIGSYEHRGQKMTNEEIIRGAIVEIETVTRWIDGGCTPPTLTLCVGVLELAARDLKSILDKKEDQKDDK